MKKPLFVAGLLIALDQIAKLIVSMTVARVPVNLIPGVLWLEPLQNTNLTWFANMAGITMPVPVMVLLQLSVALAMLLFYRYQRYTGAVANRSLGLSFAAAIAGVGCSYIDVVFWGGSLDFIGLFNWFVFDLKDIFLNVGCISLAVWYASRNRGTAAVQKVSFKTWVLDGCKLS
jgi:signal peptidase II